MNSITKIMFASASGAVIGYAVASQLLHGWLFVGAIIGAIAGWFLYDPAQFFASVKGTVGFVCESTCDALMSTWNEDWKPVRILMWKKVVSLFVLCQFVFTIMMYMLLVHAYLGGWSARLYIPYVMVAVMLSICIYAIVMGNMVLDLFCKIDRDDIRYGRKKGVTLDHPWKFFLRTNVVTLWFVAIIYLAKGIVVVCGWIPTIVRFIYLVAVMTFRLAHSNGRLSSAIGGAVGAIIGLWAGYLIVAMLVGAIVGGVAHYAGRFYSAEYVEELKANLTGKKARA
ncbi:MAG: hypothetical protein KBC33_01005 [Candidatus Pacebacteria bacterium]|nr:hypothetical protein [Candidatus Paceibacterota bacterium]